MGKLGKKARKFAKKNLQSVLRNRRKTKALLKKKSVPKDEQNSVEDQAENTTVLYNRRKADDEDFEVTSLEAIFNEDDSDVAEDTSDSDGFLSEDSSCPWFVESENERNLEGDNNNNALSMQNRKIHEELSVAKRKLDRLKTKDPGFGTFLESYNKDVETSGNEEMYSDEDEACNHKMLLVDEDGSGMNESKLLTNSVINSWCQLVTKDHNESALILLLNGYRIACHYGAIGPIEAASSHKLQNSEAYCSILMFVLREADSIFRGLLKISSSSCKKETILELKNTSKWKSLKSLVKSYLRSTLFLLNQVTYSEILAFSLGRLRASIIFFAAFPSLLRRLVKTTVHLWATGGGALSSCSFLIIRDVALVFNQDYFDTCVIKLYKAYIAHCNVLEIDNVEHIHFLRDSLVELCSLDVQKSSSKAVASTQHLAKILKQGLCTRKKEAVKKVRSWQYASCIDLWVLFISTNTSDYDLQSLFYLIVQLINGVVHLFPGPRYFPLRLKCIQWLNNLSNSSGIFIPLASYILDLLEYNIGKVGGKHGKAFKFASVLKLPKHLLKSQNFQDECVLSAIELLSVHFAQWSCHISFPELATVPLIRLRKFHGKTKIEGLQRVVRRLIDYVEQNVDFVQKKRDEVAFSPKDHQSVESFLQLEKGNLNTPFVQYYTSVMEKASLRNLLINGRISLLLQKKSKRRRGQLPHSVVDASADTNADKSNFSVGDGRTDPLKRRRMLKA